MYDVMPSVTFLLVIFLQVCLSKMYVIKPCECSYLAPEFLMHGIVDEKTDVFAFGVLLLELITGRRALDYSRQSLVIWVSLISPTFIILVELIYTN